MLNVQRYNFHVPCSLFAIQACWLRKKTALPQGYLIGDSKLTWGGFGRGDGLFEVVIW
jgi:hypothetical protein